MCAIYLLKSSRSLSHLLMSSCKYICIYAYEFITFLVVIAAIFALS